MNHGSLFSGIGGFDLAAQWAGYDNIFHCEWNDFGQRVLKHYWPNAISYEDITKVDFRLHRGHIDILTGGFPCQPYSSAGKRLGKEDERHLWPEMLRAIREIQPRWVVGENVLGLVNWNGGLVFDEVQADLEAEGYEVQPFILPAASTNAPHRRDRVWFVAYASGSRARNNHRKVSHEKWGASPNRSKSLRQTHGEACTSGINTTDTNGSAIDSNKRNDGRITGEDESESREERVQEWNEVRQLTESSQIRRDATNSKCHGLEHGSKSGSIGESKGEARQRVAGHASTESQDGHSTNSDSERSIQDNGQGKSRQFNQESARTSWETFPTQSPICGGDDGLPTELDGITFPKWRNESIKAYGNAVVPQVVYQIFKAINQYEAEEVQRMR